MAIQGSGLSSLHLFFGPVCSILQAVLCVPRYVYFFLSQKKLDGFHSLIQIEANQQGIHLSDKDFDLKKLELGCSVSLSRKAKNLQ